MTKRSPARVCQSVDDASDLLKTVANPNRLAIVCHLMEKSRSVAQLEEDLGIEQPTLSQQLTYLRNAGIITGTRDARNVVYQIRDRRIRSVILTLRILFAELEDMTMKQRAAGRPMDGHGMPFDLSMGTGDDTLIDDSMFD